MNLVESARKVAGAPESEQVTRSIGHQKHRRYQHWAIPLDAAAALGFASLSALACCSWLVIQWLSLALYAVGGAAAFHLLIRYEATILIALSSVELLAARLSHDRIGRLVGVALGGLAIGLGSLRLLWEFERGFLLGTHPLYVVFVHRQQVLLVALGAAIALRGAGQLAPRWRARSGRNRARAANCCRLGEGESAPAPRGGN